MPENMRFFNFKSVELVHIGRAPADIVAIAGSRVEYTDDGGKGFVVDLAECARVYQCLRERGAFPPGEDLDWGALIDRVPGFSALELPLQAVVGLRGAIDERLGFSSSTAAAPSSSSRTTITSKTRCWRPWQPPAIGTAGMPVERRGRITRRGRSTSVDRLPVPPAPAASARPRTGPAGRTRHSSAADDWARPDRIQARPSRP